MDQEIPAPLATNKSYARQMRRLAGASMAVAGAALSAAAAGGRLLAAFRSFSLKKLALANL